MLIRLHTIRLDMSIKWRARHMFVFFLLLTVLQFNRGILALVCFGICMELEVGNVSDHE